MLPRISGKIRLKLEAKVILSVLMIMALLIAFTFWIVNRRFTQRFQEEASNNLAAANAVFSYSQEIRNRNFLSRYINVSNEPRVKSMSALFFNSPSSPAAKETVAGVLDQLLQELDGDLIAVTEPSGNQILRGTHGLIAGTPGMNAAIEPSVNSALRDSANVDVIDCAQTVFTLVSVPIELSGRVVGALTFGSKVDQAVTREFPKLTRTEIVLLAGERVIASTLPDHADLAKVVSVFADCSRHDHDENGVCAGTRPVILNDEHFHVSAGKLPALSGEAVLGYLLLASYERPLQELRAIQRDLFAVSLLVMLLASAIVWILVRRITRPLRKLRDSVEAVGKGDFTHLATVNSNDECGELASAFNTMTLNLKTSREELESTVRTLKNTREKLLQSEKLSAIGEFVAGVTHELNNPLTAVVGFADLLRHSDPDERHRVYLDNIVDNAKRSHKIVQSLLSFARQQPQERRRINLTDCLDKAVAFVQYECHTSNIEIRRVQTPRPLTVLGDAHQLQQVFLNIVNNARQAIEGHTNGGWIEVHSEIQNRSALVTISDSGPGIDPEFLPRIFDPFFTTKETGKGTGLGMSLSYGIIQEHGGNIQVRNHPDHGGACFTIEIPIIPDAGSETGKTTETEAGETERTNRGDGRGKRVLIVDDEESLRVLMREALLDSQYHVDAVEDGKTALNRLRTEKYDLTVCDWKMPGLNGRQVFETLLIDRPEAARHFMFITGDVINQKTQDFLSAHSRKCLAKPFSVDQFREAVREATA